MKSIILLSLVFSFILSGCSSSTKGNALLGKWTRSDGGYQLEIISVDAGGKVEAKYFNPNQIHVSEATMKSEAGGIQLHVTLVDTGYPGCTYDLKLAEDGKQMSGIYFQAALNQSYEVVFQKDVP